MHATATHTSITANNPSATYSMAVPSTDTVSESRVRTDMLDSRSPPTCPMLLSSFAAEAFTEWSAVAPSHWAIPCAHSQPRARDGRPISTISVRYWATREGLPTPRDTSMPIS